MPIPQKLMRLRAILPLHDYKKLTLNERSIVNVCYDIWKKLHSIEHLISEVHFETARKFFEALAWLKLQANEYQFNGESFFSYALEHSHDNDIYELGRDFNDNQEKLVIRSANKIAIHMGSYIHCPDEWQRHISPFLKQLEHCFEITLDRSLLNHLVTKIQPNDIGCLEMRSVGIIDFISEILVDPRKKALLLEDLFQNIHQEISQLEISDEHIFYSVYQYFRDYLDKEVIYKSTLLVVTKELLDNFLKDIYSLETPLNSIELFERAYPIAGFKNQSVFIKAFDFNTIIKNQKNELISTIDHMINQLKDPQNYRPLIGSHSKESVINRIDPFTGNSTGYRCKQERGHYKEGVYTKKTAVSLPLPNANGSIFMNYPVVFVFLASHCEKHSKYIWEKNAYTNEKRWLEFNNQRPARLEKSISFIDLLDKTRQAPPGSGHNELLVGLQKKGLIALELRNNEFNNRIEMLRLKKDIEETLFANEKTDLPILIFNREKQKIYTRDAIISDLIREDYSRNNLELCCYYFKKYEKELVDYISKKGDLFFSKMDGFFHDIVFHEMEVSDVEFSSMIDDIEQNNSSAKITGNMIELPLLGSSNSSLSSSYSDMNEDDVNTLLFFSTLPIGIKKMFITYLNGNADIEKNGLFSFNKAVCFFEIELLLHSFSFNHPLFSSQESAIKHIVDINDNVLEKINLSPIYKVSLKIRALPFVSLHPELLRVLINDIKQELFGLDLTGTEGIFIIKAIYAVFSSKNHSFNKNIVDIFDAVVFCSNQKKNMNIFHVMMSDHCDFIEDFIRCNSSFFMDNENLINMFISCDVSIKYFKLFVDNKDLLERLINGYMITHDLIRDDIRNHIHTYFKSLDDLQKKGIIDYVKHSIMFGRVNNNDFGIYLNYFLLLSQDFFETVNLLEQRTSQQSIANQFDTLWFHFFSNPIFWDLLSKNLNDNYYKFKQLVLKNCSVSDLITHLLVLPCNQDLNNVKWISCFLELIEFSGFPNHIKRSYLYFAIDKNITNLFLVELLKRTNVLECDDPSLLSQLDVDKRSAGSFVISMIEDKTLNFLDSLFHLYSDINHLKKYMVMALDYGIVSDENSLIKSWPKLLDFFCRNISNEKNISLLAIIFCARKHIKNVDFFEHATNVFFALKLKEYLSADLQNKFSLSKLEDYRLPYMNSSSSRSSNTVSLVDLDFNTKKISCELLMTIWSSIEKAVDFDCQSSSNFGFFSVSKTPKFWSTMPHLNGQIDLAKAIDEMSKININTNVFTGRDTANKYYYKLFYTARKVILDLIATDNSLINDALDSNYQPQ